jgi:hypothetical protein
MANNDTHKSRPNESTWYYEREGRQVGPFALQELDQLKAAGIVSEDTPLTQANEAPAPTREAPADAHAEPEEIPEDGRQDPAPAAAGPTKATAADDVPLPPPPPDAPRAGEAVEQVMEAQVVEADDPRMSDWNRLREIAKWHRVMNLAALAGILGGGAFLRQYPMLAGVPIMIAVVLLTVMLARPLRLAVWAYALLALLLVGIVGTQVSFVPNLLEISIVATIGFFIYLNVRATQELRYAGIKIGFLGTSLPSTPPPSFGTKGESPFAPCSDQVSARLSQQGPDGKGHTRSQDMGET